MKLGKTALVCAILGFATTGAQAGSGPYEIEVTGLPGLAIHSGSTIWQPAPLYPKMALRKRLEGEVLVEYSVNEHGRAENIHVLESSPRGFFNNATIRALESATFGIAYESGEPVAVNGLKKRFIYMIEEESADDSNHRISMN